MLFFRISLCYCTDFFDPLYLHSFPTRRSSDLIQVNALGLLMFLRAPAAVGDIRRRVGAAAAGPGEQELVIVTHLKTFTTGDRKSTRLNSSHRTISYAVFCLKKKNYFKTRLESH